MSDLIQYREAVYAHHFAAIPHELPVKKLLLISDFAVKKITSLKTLIVEDDCRERFTQDTYQLLINKIALSSSQAAFAKALRHFRHYHLLRLYIRELAGFSTIEETTADWSDCADVIITYALRYCQEQLLSNYGVACDEEGNSVQLYTIAMGKLGGKELNFSSDIDLIFAFSRRGKTNGATSISNQDYFSKIIQQFMQLLQNVTADGFVFRVDLRLRPNGDSGPLVSPVSAMETYYQEQGRDWERYAMVKARLIGFEKCDRDSWFDRLITPFVYRRYVDFSVIESLRSMKGMIEREVRLNSMLDDIKRGRGGIREVEFIIQSFQLIRGGRLPQLRQQNAVKALDVLRKEQLLSHTTPLEQAYWFLRKLENALQARNDQQIHRLPSDETARMQIAVALGFKTWDKLSLRIEQYRRIINFSFCKVLSKADIYEDEKRLLANQLSNVWHGHVETNMANNLLASLGFKDPERCYQMINAFRHGPRCRRLTQTARLRLDRFMVLVLNELTQVKNTDAVLLQVIHLLENIVGRSAYLALLTENPVVLQELLYWFEQSPFITSLIVKQPFLLEVLIDQDRTWKPPTRKKLQQDLCKQLSHSTDEESHNEMLREFKLTAWLLAARSELYNQCDAIKIARFLADVAEVIITEVLIQARNQLNERFPEMSDIANHFAIIAYGKLGAQEMSYSSDVDLVFLHDVSPSEVNLVNRLTQKILHTLTLRLQSGVLYPVDTRLRPSGSAGLLVSHVDAFVDYQRQHAWTWEHQALIRARPLSSSQTIQSHFNQLKHHVLLTNRDNEKLAYDVRVMRKKINNHVANDEIKYVAGGLLDLEFLVQYLVLAFPDENLLNCTNTLLQLKQLNKNKSLSNEHFKQLKKAYSCYHSALHQSLLQSSFSDISHEKAAVLAIAKQFY